MAGEYNKAVIENGNAWVSFLRNRAMPFERAEPLTLKYLFFGHYLLRKGLITFDDILNAGALQKRTNLRIGEIAKKRGWMTDGDIKTLLAIQEETLGKFGEIAVRESGISSEQLSELLRIQDEEYLFFGQALLKLGLISDQKLMENLKEYNKLNLEKPV